MGQQDRAFIADGVFAWFRRRRSLEELAQTHAPGKARAGGHSCASSGISVRELSPLLKEADVAWLAEFKSRLATRACPPPSPPIFPTGSGTRLGEAYGDDERAALARAWLAPAPLDLRVNPLKTTRDDARAALAASGIDAAPTPYSPLGLRVAGRPSLATASAVRRRRARSAGRRQPARRAFSWRRSARDMVVDFCAGAGGKTLLLGALMRSQGRLYAFDRTTGGSRISSRGSRAPGCRTCIRSCIAHERDTKVKRLAGKIDRVLVDAPCTGFGTLRRNPDLKWRQPESARRGARAPSSTSILAAAATLVKPGGRLVYATCSVLPEENEAIVAAFLAAHPGIHARQRRGRTCARRHRARHRRRRSSCLPHRHGCDGFFARECSSARRSTEVCARRRTDSGRLSRVLDVDRFQPHRGRARHRPRAGSSLPSSLLCFAVGWMLDRRVRLTSASDAPEVVRLGLGSVNRLLFPLVTLAAARSSRPRSSALVSSRSSSRSRCR